MPQDDEYTLGNNEIPNLENILDSRYERDFEQKFMQNKHNFEQVDQLLGKQEQDDQMNGHRARTSSKNSRDYFHDDSNISIALEQRNPLSDNKHR